MNRLRNKVAIVTGAGRTGNIGEAICRAFLREGATGVVATDLRDDEADRLRAGLGDDRLHFARHDVTDPDSWRHVVAETVDRFGGLDVLVNNAGISIHGGIAETSLSDLRKVMAVNHDALFLGIQVCTPELARRAPLHAGGTAIINNLSIGSYMSSANNIGYHVAKAAARMLTMCAAKELGPKRIRVNSVHPGVTMTPLIREALADYVARGVWSSETDGEASLAALNKLGTTGRPDDLAHAFVYLASDEARFITGTALSHDGSCERY